MTNKMPRAILLSMKVKFFVAPLAIFAVVAVASLALNGIDYTWSSWQPATCMPGNCFCELQRDGLIRQPINTYSNLAFVLVGLLILAIGREDGRRGEPRNAMQSQRAFWMVFGLAAIAIGAGSFFYHASLTFVGQWFDVMGMYLFITFALAYNYARLRPIRPAIFVIGYVVMNAMLCYLLIVNPAARRQAFTVLVYCVIALELLVLLVERPRIKTRYFVSAIGLLAIAYGIWTLDESGLLCVPASWLQGHAVWHVLTALSAGSLYLYYGSENGKVDAR